MELAQLGRVRQHAAAAAVMPTTCDAPSTQGLREASQRQVLGRRAKLSTTPPRRLAASRRTWRWTLRRAPERGSPHA